MVKNTQSGWAIGCVENAQALVKKSSNPGSASLCLVTLAIYLTSVTLS